MALHFSVVLSTISSFTFDSHVAKFQLSGTDWGPRLSDLQTVVKHASTQ